MPYEILAERQKIVAAAGNELSPERPMAMTILRERDLERMPFAIPATPEAKKRQQEDPLQEVRPESAEELRRRERNVYALRLGRLLHLRGEYGGEDSRAAGGGKSEEEVSEIVERGAKTYYLRAKLTKRELDEVDRLLREGYEFVPGRRLAPEQVNAMHQMRDDATYWLGLIWFASGGYQAVEQFLLPLADEKSDNQWLNGARYNLARTYEALGKFPEAIKLYEADKSPQQYGNRLRADRIKATSAEKK
jgi:tetratricopeptide (TPR) repeat protein